MRLRWRAALGIAKNEGSCSGNSASNNAEPAGADTAITFGGAALQRMEQPWAIPLDARVCPELQPLQRERPHRPVTARGPALWVLAAVRGESHEAASFVRLG